MSGLALIGGVGRGISRGSEDWRAWDEEKRKKQQHEFQQEQNKRTKDQWSKEDAAAADIAREGYIPNVETDETVPDPEYGGYKKTGKKVKPTEAQAQARQAEIYRFRGLNQQGDSSAARAAQFRQIEDADQERQIMRAMMQSLRLADAGDHMGALRAYAPLLGPNADVQFDMRANTFAVVDKATGQPMLAPRPFSPKAVDDAMKAALRYVNYQTYKDDREAGQKDRQIGNEESRTRIMQGELDLRGKELTEAKIPLTQAQIRGIDADINYKRSLAAAAGTKADAEKWSAPQIISIPETGQSAFWQFDQTGKEKIPRITFLPRGFNAKGAVEAIKVDDYELPKGSGLTGGKMITYKDGEIRVIGSDPYGNIKEVARRGGMSGLGVPKPDFTPGATNAPGATPSSAGNVEAPMDGPSQSVNAPGVGAPGVSMPGPGPQIGGGRGIPAPAGSMSTRTDADLRRLAAAGNEEAAAELARRPAGMRGIQTDSWGREPQ